ncbi:MAG: cytochrome P460 family protein [Armatimonadetes bacterium]|nr:cytochrome P460 family protein [Armatimonadota bacterium]
MFIRASGRDIWDYLKKMDYAKKWKMWPGKGAFYKGKEPHGALLTTYVNDSAYMAITEKKGILPEGAIVAKENYSPDKKLMAITVMYKLKGYNPQRGDWFWAKYLSNGKIEGEGKMDMCINCHSMEEYNDYIMTSSLK